jgi:hypothetical protein
MNDQEIIHFAGPPFTFGTITRQRCLWCGALIQECDLANIGVEESSRKPEMRGKPLDLDKLGWWDGLVGVTGTNPMMYRVIDDPEDKKAPKNSCMVLMPEEINI